jgi:pyruvate formate lyase activating enzyme
MTEPDHTSAATLIRAAEIGQEAGLHFVYAGNMPGQVGPYENTFCPNCQALLVERLGYVLLGYHLTEEGKCPKCGSSIPGWWPEQSTSVRVGTPRDLFSRRPRFVK